MTKLLGVLLSMALIACSSPPNVPTAPVDPEIKALSQPLSWERAHPERLAWSNALIALIGQKLFAQFDKAQDASRFCAKYGRLTQGQKTLVWAELIVWTAYYESSWKPAEHFKEPPPLGYDSIGLLQLSYEDTQYSFCDLKRSTKSLEDPIKNLDCGARIMALLVNKYGFVSNGHQGAAAYWSTLRAGHKIDQIAAHVGALGFCQ